MRRLNPPEICMLVSLPTPGVYQSFAGVMAVNPLPGVVPSRCNSRYSGRWRLSRCITAPGTEFLPYQYRPKPGQEWGPCPAAGCGQTVGTAQLERMAKWNVDTSKIS